MCWWKLSPDSCLLMLYLSYWLLPAHHEGYGISTVTFAFVKKYFLLGCSLKTQKGHYKTSWDMLNCNCVQNGRQHYSWGSISNEINKILRACGGTNAEHQDLHSAFWRCIGWHQVWNYDIRHTRTRSFQDWAIAQLYQQTVPVSIAGAKKPFAEESGGLLSVRVDSAGPDHGPGGWRTLRWLPMFVCKGVFLRSGGYLGALLRVDLCGPCDLWYSCWRVMRNQDVLLPDMKEMKSVRCSVERRGEGPGEWSSTNQIGLSPAQLQPKSRAWSGDLTLLHNRITWVSFSGLCLGQLLALGYLETLKAPSWPRFCLDFWTGRGGNLLKLLNVAVVHDGYQICLQFLGVQLMTRWWRTQPRFP